MSPGGEDDAAVGVVPSIGFVLRRRAYSARRAYSHRHSAVGAAKSSGRRGSSLAQTSTRNAAMAVMGSGASGRWSEAAMVLPGDSSVAVMPPASRAEVRLEAATAFPGMIAHSG